MKKHIPNSRTAPLINGQFDFAVGQLLRRETTVFFIEDRYDDHLILRNVVSNDRRFVSLDALHSEYLCGRLVPCEPKDIKRAHDGDLFTEDENIALQLAFVQASPAARRHAEIVVRYIRELRALGHCNLRPTPVLKLEFQKVKTQLESEQAFESGVSLKLTTIYKWSRIIDQNGGDWRAALPKFSDRGGGSTNRGDERANILLEKVVDRLKRNTKAKISYAAIEDEVRRDLAQSVSQTELFAIVPSRSKIQRRIGQEFSKYDIVRRNRGVTAANKKFRDFYPRDRAERPLEVIEFDDKDTRCFCIDEKNGLPFGRVFITAGVDQNSAVVVGASTSEKHRSTWSALCAFANTVLPKDRSSPSYSGVESNLEFYGTAGILIFDNALYNHAEAMRSAIAEVSNSICAWSKPRTPTEKSVIEDLWWRIIIGYLSKLPGYGGEKTSRDGLRQGLENANLTVQQFIQGLNKWIYDDYSNTPREGGLSPRQKWHAGMRNTVPRLPRDLHRLRAAIAIGHKVRFRPDGILFGGLPYQSPQLILLRKWLGSNAEVHFRYNPENLGSIYVLDPRIKEYFLVPSTVPEYASSITYYQHCLIRKMARENGRKNPVILQLLEYRARLAQLVSQARWSGKQRERKWARQVGEMFTSPSEEITQSTWTESVTDLEYQVEAINDVQIETSDEGWNLPEAF